MREIANEKDPYTIVGGLFWFTAGRAGKLMGVNSRINNSAFALRGYASELGNQTVASEDEEVNLGNDIPNECFQPARRTRVEVLET